VLPVLFSLGPLHLYGYGAAITLGAIVAARILWLRRVQMGLPDEDSYWALINIAAMSGFLGGKLMFMLQFGISRFSLMNGYASFGGFVSVPLAIYAFARWKKIPFLKLADYMFMTAFIWHAFGRLGCFLAGCCYGKPTTLPWGVVFRNERSMVPRELLGVPLHPTQLYEVFGILAICAVMWRILRATEEGKVQPGLVVAVHLAGYGVLRFLNEFARADGIPLYGWFTQEQAFGLALVAASGAVLCWRRRCSRSC
jgi:phosphatidylglycerol---prolipoprotein diacylglyceryl transferase